MEMKANTRFAMPALSIWPRQVGFGEVNGPAAVAWTSAEWSVNLLVLPRLAASS